MLIGRKARGVTPVPIGENAPPVLFTHVGITGDAGDEQALSAAIHVELQKAHRAVELGADIICDVSTDPRAPQIHKALMAGLSVPFGLVSVYESFVRLKNTIPTPQALLEDVRSQIARGADVITLHATIFKGDRARMDASKRIIKSTSRGGMMMLELMERGGFENPYYTNFKEIVALCARHGVAVSFGPAFRPASVVDCHPDDPLTRLELERMAVLTEAAHHVGVTVMIEGIGHAPLNQIPAMIAAAKRACPHAAYRVMTVSCDLALGFDHISSALASATAVQYGADSITCVTRREHLGVPALKDVEEGVIAARIAAHSGYIARTGIMQRDAEMSISRRNCGCSGNPSLSLFPLAAQHEILAEGKVGCSMCGEFCPINKLTRQR